MSPNSALVGRHLQLATLRMRCGKTRTLGSQMSAKANVNVQLGERTGY